jgi:hypothetical protein
MNADTAGRSLLTLNAVVVMLGGFIADMGATHMRNPRWPPHAKFHNAQTIGLGALLGSASLWFTWRKKRPTDLDVAVLTGGAIYASWIFATLLPGTAWTDPEFLEKDQSLEQVPPQLYLGAAMSALLVAGALLIRSGAKKVRVP